MTFDNFITIVLAEDIGEGDHTTLACISDSADGQAELIIKENGIMAGIELAIKIFNTLDNSLSVKKLIEDGSKVKAGNIAFTIQGNIHSILKGERVVLNCMQRMSGIATITNSYVKKLEGLKTKILDTRKTTPGFRMLEKWAVKIGGGLNHRAGLYDMILIKDNHIDFAGGIKQAINSTAKYLECNMIGLKVEIEARNLKEVKEIIAIGGVNRIMLDNFSLQELKKAVKLIDGKFETEASGGITLDTVREYAECGVDYISVGALTHSYKSLDISLKAKAK